MKFYTKKNFCFSENQIKIIEALKEAGEDGLTKRQLEEKTNLKCATLLAVMNVPCFPVYEDYKKEYDIKNKCYRHVSVFCYFDKTKYDLKDKWEL